MKFWLVNFILFLFFLIFFTETALSQSQSSNGLKFFNLINFQKFSSQSTSLNLNTNNPFSFENNFNLQFEFSLCDTNSLGLINYINNTVDFYIALLYSRHNRDNKLGLKLSINGDSLYILEDFDIEKIIYPNWANITIKINSSDSSFILKLDTSIVFNHKLPTSNLNALNVKYGHITQERQYPLGLHSTNMMIKDIKVSLDGNLKYYWPLDEIEGNVALDTINGYKALQQNGQWLKKENIFWKNVDSLEFDEKPCVAYDETREVLYFVNQNYLTIYSLKDKRKKKITYTNEHPYTADKLIYNPIVKNLISYYSGGEGEITIFNEKKRMWSQINTKKDTLQRYYYHAAFVNPLNGEVLTLGGYGFNTNKNSLRKYNFANKTWEKIKTQGDYFTPRCGSAIGYGKEPWEIYVFSGFGNPSGNQELGFHNLNDLYKLDLRDYSFKKLWEINNRKFNTVANFDRMILDSTKNVFYLLIFDRMLTKEKDIRPKLYEISITDSTIKEASEYIPAASNAFLSFDKKENRFIETHFIKNGDKTFAYIYSLKHPPENYTDAFNNQQRRIEKFTYRKSDNLFFILVITAIFLFVLIWLVKKYYVKLFNHNKTPDREINYGLSNSNGASFDIRLFGGLTILSHGGDKLCDKLSTKLCELFLLIFIYTFNTSFLNSKRGISTEKMTNILWPDYSQDDAKNIRGVTFNHLRKILNGLTGIKIIFKDKYYYFSISENLKVDMLSYSEFKYRFDSQNYDMQDVAAFIKIFENGGLLPGKSYFWLDPIKISTDEESVKILSSLYNQNENNGDNVLLLSLSDAILKIDPVNEKGLQHKLYTLSLMNQHTLIQKTYEQFAEEYERLYDEHYPKLLDELI